LLDSKGFIKKSLTFGQFWQQTGLLATHLFNEGLKPQERVMIIYPITSILEYFTAFVACIRIGVVPVSIYPPNPKTLKKDLVKFEAFLENAQSTVAITTAEYKRFVNVSSLTNKWPASVKKWIATDSLLKKSIAVNDDVLNFEHSDSDLMFIQFTSGSTGNPKGVPIHHASLVKSVSYGRTEIGQKTDSHNCFYWLPFYHDLGLISSLGALYAGATMYSLDPISYISNPLIWPIVLERYAINYTSGPKFSYALTSRKMREKGLSKAYDLSNLRYICISAEPIIQSTIKSMVEDFGITPSAIRHFYGAAEACVLISSEISLFDQGGVAACGNIEHSIWIFLLLIAIVLL
jgi:acyl-CoA synthetase (AMP-forming)/AMP-acid ligase II